MGLAASQARLLSITSRKSDCELESMRLSHQKIAMSRDLTDVSNEYQDSLNHTKLFYDYYGKNDQSTQLSYGVLMKPSTLNDYMPILITDATGRAVLDPSIASAARAAGIPQEGLGCLPSTEMRNKFVAGLFKAGIITYEQAENIAGTTYNQKVGMGGTNGVTVETEVLTLNQLAEKLKNMDDTSYNFLNDKSLETMTRDGFEGLEVYDVANAKVLGSYNVTGDSSPVIESKGNDVNLNLADILTGNIVLWGNDWDNGAGSRDNIAEYLLNCGYWDFMYETFSEILGLNGNKDYILEYAMQKMMDNFYVNNLCSDDTPANGKVQYGDSNITSHKYSSAGSHQSNMISNMRGGFDELGCMVRYNKRGKKKNDSCAGINLSDMTRAFLTYFKEVDINEGFQDGNDYNVDKSKSLCKLVDGSTEFEILKSVSYDDDTLQLSAFYDALFNQICQKGWSENANITDNSYLQNMLQNGTGYITRVKDDGYYYQGNYATDSYIKEVSDETYIAQAEAKYNTEKAKINQKEQTIDMKMKNLDTEISSLTTEYDTVKNVISKNIEKGFKRYNA